MGRKASGRRDRSKKRDFKKRVEKRLQWLLIDSPNLRCEHCWTLYADNDGQIVPMCRTACGCPIKDLASDAAVNAFIERYRIARTLYETNKIDSLLLRELKALGLDKDSIFLLTLENIFKTYFNNLNGKSK